MSPTTRRVTRILPIDERGRRVVDQVLADWTFEAASNRTRVARFLTHAKYVRAMTAVLVSTSTRAVIRAPVTGFVATSLLYLLLFYVLALVVPSSVSGRTRHLPTGTAAQLVVLLFASYGASFLPVAAFLAALRGSVRDWRRHDWLIASVGGFTVLVVFMGWFLPDINQSFRVLSFHAAGSTGTLTRGPGELTFAELFADGSPRATAILTGRLGVAITLPIVLYVASRVTAWSASGRCAFGFLTLAVWVLLLEIPANLVPIQIRAFVVPAAALLAGGILSLGSRQNRDGNRTMPA